MDKAIVFAYIISVIYSSELSHPFSIDTIYTSAFYQIKGYTHSANSHTLYLQDTSFSTASDTAPQDVAFSCYSMIKKCENPRHCKRLTGLQSSATSDSTAGITVFKTVWPGIAPSLRTFVVHPSTLALSFSE